MDSASGFKVVAQVGFQKEPPLPCCVVMVWEFFGSGFFVLSGTLSDLAERKTIQYMMATFKRLLIVVTYHWFESISISDILV